jgi:hypothetical protein
MWASVPGRRLQCADVTTVSVEPESDSEDTGQLFSPSVAGPVLIVVGVLTGENPPALFAAMIL